MCRYYFQFKNFHIKFCINLNKVMLFNDVKNISINNNSLLKTQYSLFIQVLDKPLHRNSIKNNSELP